MNMENVIKTKKCCKCHCVLPISAFFKHKNRNDGLQTVCKKCSLGYSRIKEKRNMTNWITFFIDLYGAEPKCEICGTPLKWQSDNQSEIVNFDHTKSDVPIRQGPQGWIRSRTLTKEREDMWKESNFGILCSRCNNGLPTLNRKKWLQQVTIYINKHYKDNNGEENE